MSGMIGYSEFIDLCKIHDPRDWGGFRVAGDGVYVIPPPDDAILFPAERAALTWHPTGNLLEPALRFPCTQSELQMFLKEIGETEFLYTDEDSAELPTLRAQERAIEAPPAPEQARSEAQQGSSGSWKEQARKIADECFDRDTASRCRDSLAGYASRVMDEMQKRGIHGPRGRIDNPNTIQREALQGGKWWAKKKP